MNLNLEEIIKKIRGEKGEGAVKGVGCFVVIGDEQ